MADDRTDPEDDDLEEQPKVGEPTDDESSADTVVDDAAAPSEDEGDEDDDGDDLVVTIGDAPPAPEDSKAAPEWVRELRKSNQAKDRRIRELEAKVAASQPTPQAVVVGEKPRLEDFNYDAAKFETEFEAWQERKRQADDQRKEAERAQQAEQETWQRRINAYDQAKAKLKVRDFPVAEDAFKATMSVVQQGIVLAGADKAEIMIYALGKNPAKARELAAITDPVKFAWAAAKLETQMKVARRAAPPPETVPRGGSSAGAAVLDNQLEQLRKEAEKTGDYTKVHAFKNEQRAKDRKRA